MDGDSQGGDIFKFKDYYSQYFILPFFVACVENAYIMPYFSCTVGIQDSMNEYYTKEK